MFLILLAMKPFIFLIFCLLSSFPIYSQSPISSFSTSLPIISGNLILCANDVVEFYNTSSNTNQTTTYSWSFGVGASPFSSNLNSNIAVSYSQVGSFVASLLVNNNNGQPVSIYSLNVIVQANPLGAMSLINQGNGFSTSTFNGVTVFKNISVIGC